MTLTVRTVFSLLLVALLAACDREAGQGAAVVNQASSDDFRMPVLDIFAITGKGTVLTGKVIRGSVSVGSTVCIGSDLGPLAVIGIEKFGKILDSADAGQNVGLLFSEQLKSVVEPGVFVEGCDD